MRRSVVRRVRSTRDRVRVDAKDGRDEPERDDAARDRVEAVVARGREELDFARDPLELDVVDRVVRARLEVARLLGVERRESRLTACPRRST